MKYAQTCGVLKQLSEITLPDPRLELEPYKPRNEVPLDVSDIHERLEAFCKIHDGVPERIKTQFEIARNLMLYTFFVFEFQTQAELQAYAALEYGLRERFGCPTRKIKQGKKIKAVPLMLKELLQKAIDEELINPEKLPSWDWANQRRKYFAEKLGKASVPVAPKDWLEMIVRAIANLRNHIAHGNPHLNLPNSFNQMELCADLINALFPRPFSNAK